jgi:hypothetical protein
MDRSIAEILLRRPLSACRRENVVAVLIDPIRKSHQLLVGSSHFERRQDHDRQRDTGRLKPSRRVRQADRAAANGRAIYLDRDRIEPQLLCGRHSILSGGHQRQIQGDRERQGLH